MTCTAPRLLRRTRPAAPTAALLLALLVAWAPPVAAAPGGSVQDFRLPPGPGSAPQQEQPPQGPVAPDVPASREVLRPAPAPTATATPGPGASPRIVLPPVAMPAPAAGPRSSDPAAAPVAAPPSPAASDGAPGETPMPKPAGDSAGPAAAATPGPLPAQPTADAAGEAGAAWLWPLAALLVAAGLVAAGLAAGIRARRRRGAGAPTATPAGERPVPARPLPLPLPLPQPQPPLPAPEPDAETGPLHIDLEPLRLTLTLMNATLAYRLVVTNRGPEPVEALVIGADMIAAHASLGREQQLAGPGEDAVRLATIERLEPGESRTVAGEYRLPLARVMPVRQGPAALLLPLARIRVESAGAAPAIRTFVVALPPGQPGARLQPIRLDLGPRIYSTLAARAFA